MISAQTGFCTTSLVRLAHFGTTRRISASTRAALTAAMDNDHASLCKVSSEIKHYLLNTRINQV